jgi:hypothetical protein
MYTRCTRDDVEMRQLMAYRWSCRRRARMPCAHAVRASHAHANAQTHEPKHKDTHAHAHTFTRIRACAPSSPYSCTPYPELSVGPPPDPQAAFALSPSRSLPLRSGRSRDWTTCNTMMCAAVSSQRPISASVGSMQCEQVASGVVSVCRLRLYNKRWNLRCEDGLNACSTHIPYANCIWYHLCEMRNAPNHVLRWTLVF